MELIAEVSLAFFFRLPMVGIAMSMRMRMMAITISSSIKVKPLGSMELRFARQWNEKKDLRFMRLPRRIEKGWYFPAHPTKILQRHDAKGKSGARNMPSNRPI